MVGIHQTDQSKEKPAALVVVLVVERLLAVGFLIKEIQVVLAQVAHPVVAAVVALVLLVRQTAEQLVALVERVFQAASQVLHSLTVAAAGAGARALLAVSVVLVVEAMAATVQLELLVLLTLGVVAVAVDHLQQHFPAALAVLVL